MNPSQTATLPLGTAQAPMPIQSEPLSVEETIGRGRYLACLAVEELIEEIRRRAAAHQLDRGLHLSLPYYDDRRLTLCRRDFTVIPRGRVMFVPAFVVVAVEREIPRVRQDRRYTETTRAHLIELLALVLQAFRSPGYL